MIQVKGKLVLVPEATTRYPRTNELCYDKARQCLYRAPIFNGGEKRIIVRIYEDTITETDLPDPPEPPDLTLSKAIDLLRAAENCKPAEFSALRGKITSFLRSMYECPDSPDGKHNFTVDMEYDSTGQTVTCEHCGESQ